MESEFQRLENGQQSTCENTGPSYSTDHGGQLISELKKVHESTVARGKTMFTPTAFHFRPNGFWNQEVLP